MIWPLSQAYPEVSVEQLNESYDYIVVGGGAAGCVLANRLSTDPTKTVLLVERGGLHESWASYVPLLSSANVTDPDRAFIRPIVKPEFIERSVEIVTGTVLGGTTRLNGMLYTRGLPAEYDAWEKAGRQGWGWAEMKHYFLKNEDFLDGAVEGIHATGGEWKVRPLTETYGECIQQGVEAAQAIGLPYIPDINSPNHPPFGIAPIHFTMDQKGRRNSVYHAFLPVHLAVKRKQNLHICTNTYVEKVVLDMVPKAGHVATGVVLAPMKGVWRSRTIKAAREVVLSAGPTASPQILMLSGIGPAEHLKEHGISVVKDLPAVGSNLQDHFAVGMGWNVPLRDSLRALELSYWVVLIELLKYLIWGTGWFLAPFTQHFIFTHTALLDSTGMPTKASMAHVEELPDIELMPVTYDTTSPEAPQTFPKGTGLYNTLSLLLRPKSHGTVRLSSADPRSPMLIDPQYLSHPDDRPRVRASLKLALRLVDQIKEQGYNMVDWRLPASESDEDLDKYMNKICRSTYHYTSTCRMAPEKDEKGGVVDDELRVHGIARLRVCDSSVFPWIPATHTQAPTVAIAEKCAVMIQGIGV